MFRPNFQRTDLLIEMIARFFARLLPEYRRLTSG